MINRILLLFVFISAVSCDTSKQAVNSSSPSKDIFGTWNYKSSSGGFTGKGTDWRDPVTLYLNKEFTYELKQNQKVIESDQFKIVSTLQGEDSVKILDLTNGLDKRYRLSGDTLFLDEMVSDGYSYIYLRAK